MAGAYMVVLIFVIMFASALGTGVIKKNIFMGIYQAFSAKDYDELFKRLDSRLAKAMMPIYMREFMRLNAYMSQQEEKKVIEQFNRMMKLKLNASQICGVLCKGFNYYMQRKDLKKCKVILKKMKEVMPEEQMRRYERHYDIVAEKSICFIPELQKSLENHKGRERGYLEFLLAKSYEAKGEKQKVESYLKKAAEDYKISMDHLEQQIQL